MASATARSTPRFRMGWKLRSTMFAPLLVMKKSGSTKPVMKGVSPPTCLPVHRPNRCPAAWYSRIFSTFSGGSFTSAL